MYGNDRNFTLRDSFTWLVSDRDKRRETDVGFIYRIPVGYVAYVNAIPILCFIVMCWILAL